jgi:hypothetical protein
MSLCCSDVEGRGLPGILCLYRCSYFGECATGISMPVLRSEMEGRGLLGILCLYRCSCFDECATDINMPILRSHV